MIMFNNWLTKFLKVYELVQMSWYEPASTRYLIEFADWPGLSHRAWGKERVNTIQTTWTEKKVGGFLRENWGAIT